MHYAVPSNKVVSLRAETMQCTVQSQSSESELPSRKEFQKNG